MIPADEHIPYLLDLCIEQHGLGKTASLVDAIIGAPVGGTAAYIAADEENKGKAARRGLVVGALLGFLAGQEAVHDSMEGKPTPKYKHPIAAAAAGGTAAGLYSRWQPMSEKEKKNSK
jgi:hypothetical protein